MVRHRASYYGVRESKPLSFSFFIMRRMPSVGISNFGVESIIINQIIVRVEGWDWEKWMME